MVHHDKPGEICDQHLRITRISRSLVIASCGRSGRIDLQMKWPSWFKPSSHRKPAAPVSLTQCPRGGAEMFRVDKSTMSGRDMRTYRCDHCQEEHIVDYGIATWKAMSDARQSND